MPAQFPRQPLRTVTESTVGKPHFSPLVSSQAQVLNIGAAHGSTQGQAVQAASTLVGSDTYSVSWTLPTFASALSETELSGVITFPNLPSPQTLQTAPGLPPGQQVLPFYVPPTSTLHLYITPVIVTTTYPIILNASIIGSVAYTESNAEIVSPNGNFDGGQVYLRFGCSYKFYAYSATAYASNAKVQINLNAILMVQYCQSAGL